MKIITLLLLLVIKETSLFACPQCDVMTAFEKADPQTPYRCISSPIANERSHKIHLTIKDQELILTLGYYPGNSDGHSVAPITDFAAKLKRSDIHELKQVLGKFLEWDAIAKSNNVRTVTKQIPCNIKYLDCFFHADRHCLANKEDFSLSDMDVYGITSQDVPGIIALLDSLDEITKSWEKAKKEKQETEIAVENAAKKENDLFQTGVATPGKSPASETTNSSGAKISNNPHNELSFAAEQGDANSQYMLACCYMKGGAGVVIDKVKGINWLRKAAEQGHVRAQQALGILYWEGEDVKKDFVEGVKWFRKAAEQGNAAAQFGLGHCYFEGEGLVKDKAEGVKWYRKAVEQENADAQVALGSCYLLGDGVGKDLTEGVKLFRIAAKQGNTDAATILKQLGY